MEKKIKIIKVSIAILVAFAIFLVPVIFPANSIRVVVYIVLALIILGLFAAKLRLNNSDPDLLP